MRVYQVIVHIDGQICDVINTFDTINEALNYLQSQLVYDKIYFTETHWQYIINTIN